MTRTHPGQGISTLVNHVAEGTDPDGSHVIPIYQTSTFSFPDVATGAGKFKGEIPGYVYTRYDNPNQRVLEEKIAVLEGLDLLRAEPQRPASELVGCTVFASGMAAATSAILARVQSGQTIIAQEALYSATFNFLHDMAPRYGIQVVWLREPTPEAWEDAFRQHPDTRLAYAESPTNPTMALTDLKAAAEAAHRYGAWLMVDNTFATPFCQRPLSLGADIIIHSTTKYISGHGQVVGGAVVSKQVDYIHNELFSTLKTLGASTSPFDCWLVNAGLKTFEIRMQRHCENAIQVARFLENHPKVAHVNYPGLENNPQHDLARRQMLAFGGMLSFELKGGLKAGEKMMNSVQLCTLAVSLGTIDSLIQHPASMTHSSVPAAQRVKVGITNGLVRLSVGVENVEDIIADLDQAMRQ
jgi:methionine-gamma-lyase